MKIQNLLTFTITVMLGSQAFALPGNCAENTTLTQVSVAKLKDGNKRYVDGHPTAPRVDTERREITAKEGQKPIATILGCSDSRVPPEIVFDQKFGNLFVIRVAGNVTGTSEIASVEYGVQALGTPLVVVLGHSACGAVQAAVEKTPLDGKLPKLVELIAPAVDKAKTANPDVIGSKLMDAAVEENVRHQISELTAKSETLKNAVDSKKIQIVGAVRDLMSGEIRWLP
ncbi:MAG: carbonic anhydrase [Candidatus Obscuribacterales bacterium]|nr:carbonic anhydrase [Candidatus Obscuribacterales bacterium]